MPRIRTIKPEFWADEKLALLSPLTRLTFLGLISLADDAGRLVDSIKALDGALFSATDDTCRGALDELAATGRIVRYRSSSGQRLIQIANWHRHQKINRPNPYTLPGPVMLDKPPDLSSDEQHMSSESSVNDHGTLSDQSRIRSSTNDLLSSTGEQRVASSELSVNDHGTLSECSMNQPSPPPSQDQSQNRQPQPQEDPPGYYSSEERVTLRMNGQPDPAQTVMAARKLFREVSPNAPEFVKKHADSLPRWYRMHGEAKIIEFARLALTIRPEKRAEWNFADLLEGSLSPPPEDDAASSARFLAELAERGYRKEAAITGETIEEVRYRREGGPKPKGMREPSELLSLEADPASGTSHSGELPPGDHPLPRAPPKPEGFIVTAFAQQYKPPAPITPEQQQERLRQLHGQARALMARVKEEAN